MLRLSLPWLYELSSELQSLTELPTTGTTVLDLFMRTYTLKTRIESLLNESVYSNSLRVCRASGLKVINAIDEINSAADFTEVVEPYKIARLSSDLQTFQVTFKAELEVVNAYFVTNKRGYDTYSLIENAAIIFPPDLLQKVSAVSYDVKEAGKCIAFELSTAAGFHLLRALETVITKYWKVVMNGAPLPTERNLGQYITKMSDAKIDGTEKALAALKQIKDLHRNPLMHPEDKLDIDECIGLLNIIQSAMVAMLHRIPVEPIGTANLELDSVSTLALPATNAIIEGGG
jgi:hypothetical protein